MLNFCLSLSFSCRVLPLDRVQPRLAVIFKNCRERIRLPNCIPESGEPVSAAQGFIWEAFHCLIHTDSLSKCVRQTHLTFCSSVLSRLPGGNVLMSYLPAWMMISKSQSSCCAKNNEESQGDGDQEQSETCRDTPETFTRPIWRRGGQRKELEQTLNAYCTSAWVEFCWDKNTVELEFGLALNSWMPTSA